MQSSLDDIRKGLVQGRYVNEASVSTGIVLRILAELGWNTYDPSQVSPEYTVANQRVDFALLVDSQPRVFIEAKRPGKGADAEFQLLQYAFHKGVQMVVLTTGQEWSFFLPAEPGDYLDRRVYLLDLLERDANVSSDRLFRYLSRERIVSGNAIEDWRRDYRDRTSRKQAVAAIPNAWTELVDQNDSTLVDLVSEKAESLSGFRPDNDDVVEFLRSLTGDIAAAPIWNSPKPKQVRPVVAPAKNPASDTKTDIGFSIAGSWTSVRRGRDVLIGVFAALHHRDPSFLERYSARFTDGKRRPVIARTKAGLYPRNPAFADRYPKDSREFVPGWFIDLNMSMSQVHQSIRNACEVAGLKLGTDVIVRLP